MQYCVHIVLYNTFAVIEVDTSKIRDRFGGMGWFKGVRMGKQCNYKLITDVTTYRYFF